MRALVLVAALIVLAPLASAQRRVIELADGWKFLRGDSAPAADFSSWETISVPHTWNALDGQNGKAPEPDLSEGYYRGPGSYALTLPALGDLAGKRVFVRFEAASLVADVWLDGAHVGQHRGGFAAFCFELTPHLQRVGAAANAKHVLRVRVDNTRVEDVAPLAGDFTVFGGLYRPVSLLVTDAVCVSPLEFGSPGVFLTTESLDDFAARIGVRTLLLSAVAAGASVELETEIKDASGAVVATQRDAAKISASESVTQWLTIARPHRWHGRRDPYLYTATVRVRREGRVVDEVAQPLGLRTIEITQERGVLLNGEPLAIRGVNRHQDRLDRGWAITRAEHEEDFRLIVEMGANAVRLAHYQQSAFVHELCDRAGLLVWEEIPLVNELRDTPEFVANARQQLTEMIVQNGNHPSQLCWGLYNELYHSWAKRQGMPSDPLLIELAALAKKLDPSRPSVAASDIKDRAPIHDVPEQLAYNIYPGWYGGSPADFGKVIEQRSTMGGRARIALSEYGYGANIAQHQEGALTQPKPNGAFHPEEWQAFAHEQAWSHARNNEGLWGTFVWVMFDFASDGRNEGETPGRNDKGLVTYDRKMRKDAFYFYKANWTEEPLARIASSRMTQRQLATTEVKAYSNCPEVELYVNGRSLGVARPDDVHIFRWPEVALAPGENRIEVVGERDGTGVRDTCVWTLEIAGGISVNPSATRTER